jgi:hypothetical protein
VRPALVTTTISLDGGEIWTEPSASGGGVSFTLPLERSVDRPQGTTSTRWTAGNPSATRSHVAPASSDA